MEDMFRVGVFSSTHGLKGEIKVYPTTDEVDRFDYIKDVIMITSKNEKINLEVTNARYFKNMVILKFKGINDINDIEKYKGSELYVTRENAIPLEDGEYYIADLLGCEVFDENNILIGTLKEVLTSSANDVYVVDSANSTDERYKEAKEVLIPYVDEYIENIDISNKIIKAKNVFRLV